MAPFFSSVGEEPWKIESKTEFLSDNQTSDLTLTESGVPTRVLDSFVLDSFTLSLRIGAGA
jgi:hypothetical protein